MKQKDISQGSAATRFRRNRSNEALVQSFVARILKKNYQHLATLQERYYILALFD